MGALGQPALKKLRKGKPKTLTQLALSRPYLVAPISHDQQEFLLLYPNRIQGILRPPGCKEWVTLSKHSPVSDETIIGAISGTEKNFWGLKWADHTRFAVFDIDPGSRYQTSQELQKLRELLAEVELTATVYQSSARRGWHVYLFFEQWARKTEVQETLKAWLTAHGYTIRNGTLEVAPDGRGFRLPLQPGFAWLDSDGNVLQRREDLTTDQAVRRFLNDLNTRTSDWAKSKNRIESQLEAIDRALRTDALAHEKAISTEGFDGLFNYRLIPEKYQDGRQYWQTGLTANGQRHDAILAVEHYLWHGDESADIPAMPGQTNDWLRYELLRAWIKSKHNGFCNHIRRGNWRKVESQIKRACLWRRPTGTIAREAYALTERAIERLIALFKSTGRVWSMDDLRKGNEGRRQNAREKIRQATELLTSQGRRVGLRQLMRLTGCNHHTIRRHADIWCMSTKSISSVASELNPFLDLDQPLGGGTVPEAAGGSEEEILLPVLVLGDSGQIEFFGRPVHNLALEISIASDSVQLQFDLGCLTPCAEDLAGRRQATDGITIEECPPSPKGIKAQGSSTGLEGLGYASGEPFLSGVRSNKLRHGKGSKAAPVLYGSGRLFVIPQTYKQHEKQTTLVLAPESARGPPAR